MIFPLSSRKISQKFKEAKIIEVLKTCKVGIFFYIKNDSSKINQMNRITGMLKQIYMTRLR